MIFELFNNAAKVRGPAAAITLHDGVISYRTLMSRVNERRREIEALIDPGDVVAVSGGDLRSFLADYMALWSFDVTIVPFSATSAFSPSPEDLRRLGVTVVRSTRETVRWRRYAPDWSNQLCANGPSLVVFTSGTTGAPKPVVHSSESLSWAVWNSCSVMDEVLLGAASVPTSREGLYDSLIGRCIGSSSPLRLFTGMPMFTIAGLTIAHRALLVGDSVAGTGLGFDLNHLKSLLATQSVDTLGLSPHMGSALLREGRASPATNAGGVLSIGVGGGPAPSQLLSDLESHFGCLVASGYGSTELGGPAIMARPTDSANVRHTTLGRPLASVSIQLRSEGAGDSATTLWCKSPSQMIGVIDDGALRPAPQWIDTGDLFERLSDGTLVASGRADGVIVRGGRRIDPVIVEAAMSTHPAIERVAVIGADSRLAGELDIVAVVVASRAVTALEMREHAIRHLEPGLRPQYFRRVSDLPMTADGFPRRTLVGACLETHQLAWGEADGDG